MEKIKLSDFIKEIFKCNDFYVDDEIITFGISNEVYQCLKDLLLASYNNNFYVAIGRNFKTGGGFVQLFKCILFG